jgi:hypothetical protein
VGSWRPAGGGLAGELGGGSCGPEGQLPVGGRGFASGAGALIEVEVRNEIGLGRVVRGRLVEVEAGIGIEGEVMLGRSPGGGERRRRGGQAEAFEDGVDGLCGGNEGKERMSPPLIALLETALDEAAWNSFSRGSAIRRAGRAGFARNVCMGR